MKTKVSKDLSKYKLEEAKEYLTISKELYDLKLYKSANNKAYYSIFHSIKSLISLMPINHKSHNSVIQYFNELYIDSGILPKEIEGKISKAIETIDCSECDDEFSIKPETAKEQIETAEELIKLVEVYQNKLKKQKKEKE